jgi:hypothetical protein
VQGWIRGREWQVNNLVHVAGAGVYQLHSAQVLADPCPLSRAASSGGGSAAAAAAPTSILATAAETLVQSLPYDPMNAEQSHFRYLCIVCDTYVYKCLLTHIASEEELAAADATRRRPAAAGGRGGRSDHMSAWLQDEDGEMLSDYEDEEEDGEDEDSDVMDSSDGGDDEDEGRDDAVGMSDDDDEEEDAAASSADDAVAAAEWRRLRQAAMQDRDFPDEVDVPFGVSARQRFARFRFLLRFPSLFSFSP